MTTTNEPTTDPATDHPTTYRDKQRVRCECSDTCTDRTWVDVPEPTADIIDLITDDIDEHAMFNYQELYAGTYAGSWPRLITRAQAVREVLRHSADPQELFDDIGSNGDYVLSARVLEWLGY